MTEQRRLAAILAADMVGYSRLMEADERGTIARQKAHRTELIDPKITEHNGRIVKTTGDGLLVEFASVVDAVECAVAIQRAMVKRETDVANDQRIQYRVGINLGDIIIEDDDIFGDGVNIAARLEQLAEPGGVCISGTAFDHLKAKVDVGYADLGEQRVKNIEKPVHAYQVLLDADAAGTVISETRPRSRRWQLGVTAAVVVALFTAGGLAWWQPWVERVEPASVEKMVFTLPEKPSIAVLPFNNLSGEPKQEYFSDGMSENIITALSKIPAMFVIARNSTFTYKGKPVKVQQVAEELGVRYVLEGGVQRAGDRVRITAQLIDALKGHHLWAESYDRKFKDIFVLQDDITRNVVTALEVKLTAGERALTQRKETENLEAYEFYLRGREHFRHLNKTDIGEAQAFYKKAVALDPNFASAWIGLAATHQLDARFGWSKNRARSISHSVDAARKALAIDANQSGGYMALANIAIFRRQYDRGIGHCEKTLSLDPTADEIAHCGRIWTYVGRSEEALELIRKAMRRNPYFPPIYFFILGNAHRLMGNYDQTITAYKAWRNADPESLPPITLLAAAYAEADQMDEARATVKEILRRSPKYSIKRPRRVLRYKDPAEIERILENLRKAGLPEE